MDSNQAPSSTQVWLSPNRVLKKEKKVQNLGRRRVSKGRTKRGGKIIKRCF